MYVKKNNTSLTINIDIKKQGDKYVVAIFRNDNKRKITT